MILCGVSDGRLKRLRDKVIGKSEVTGAEMRKLSDSQRKAITESIRGLVQRHLGAGVSTGTRVICQNCGYAKPLAGAVRYGRYRLCNDCALQYELAKAEGDVQTIEELVLTD